MLCIHTWGIPLVQSKCQIRNNYCIMVVIGLMSVYTLYNASVSLLTWISSFFLLKLLQRCVSLPPRSSSIFTVGKTLCGMWNHFSYLHWARFIICYAAFTQRWIDFPIKAHITVVSMAAIDWIIVSCISQVRCHTPVAKVIAISLFCCFTCFIDMDTVTIYFYRIYLQQPQYHTCSKKLGVPFTWMFCEIRLLNKLGQTIKEYAEEQSESQEWACSEKHRTHHIYPDFLLMALCLHCQTVTTAATPGAAVVAVWASRVTTAAC